ncbi:MAG: hypothetical protein HC854_08820 [Flavobacterium sp.]|nr:hypothetical protein [Flavobacterium sp.]
MKKISLKDVKNTLSRNEMREMFGGRVKYPSCDRTCTSDWGCGTSDGCPNCRPKSDNPQEGLCKPW